MTARGRGVLAACFAAAICLVGMTSTAQAGVPHTPFKVTPAIAATSSAITATWKVDRRLKRGEGFGFELAIVPAGPDSGALDGYECARNADMRPRVVKKGSLLRATFRPGAGRFAVSERWRTWCAGTARILLFRYPRRDDTNVSRFLGLRTVPITLAAGEVLPFTPTPVKVTLLPGSTMTAMAPGRPDRSTPVTGVLRGVVDGPFAPNRDVHVISLAGALTPASFAPDPLCPGTTPPGTLDAAPGTRLDVTTGGGVTLDLHLSGAPSQVIGCGPPGPLAGTTALTLTGSAGQPSGLGAAPVAGTSTGFALPDGTQGGLAANLVLNVDLSGRG